MSLEEAAKRARKIAETSICPLDHARAHALDAIVRDQSDKALADLLTEPQPETAPPPWSQVSQPGVCDGPLPF